MSPKANKGLFPKILVNDVRNSLTKETINKSLKDNDVGFGILDIRSSSSTDHTIFTSIDHGFNRITNLSGFLFFN